MILCYSLRIFTDIKNINCHLDLHHMNLNTANILPQEFRQMSLNVCERFHCEFNSFHLKVPYIPAQETFFEFFNGALTHGDVRCFPLSFLMERNRNLQNKILKISKINCSIRNNKYSARNTFDIHTCLQFKQNEYGFCVILK